MLRCSVLSNENEIGALAAEWRDLQMRLGLAPFTDYDWAMAWWENVGRPAGAELYVVVCHDADRLVGLVPFSVRRTKSVRVLRLLGHEVYYYRNFLIETAAAAQTLWRFALGMPVYDFADIKNINKDSAEDKVLAELAFCKEQSHVFHCAHNGGSREALLADRSRAFKRKYRNVIKKLEQKDGMVLGTDLGAGYNPDLIAFLVERKTKWAKERGKRGIFSEEKALAFYTAITELGARQGLLVLNWLRDESGPFAVTLNFAYKKVVYGHTLAIDLAHAKYMPGIFLNMEALIWASEQGFTESNYMEGEEEYKKRFGKESRLIREYIKARTFKGYLFLGLYLALCFYRKVKPKPVPPSNVDKE